MSTVTHLLAQESGAGGTTPLDFTVTGGTNGRQAIICLGLLHDGIDSAGTTTVTPSGCWASFDLLGKFSSFSGKVFYFFRAYGAYSNGTLSFAISGGGYNETFATGLNIDEVASAHTTAPIVQFVKANGTSDPPTVTLAAFASGSNATYGVCVLEDIGYDAAGSGFTQLYTADFFSGMHLQSQWRNTADTSVDTDEAGGGGAAWEIMGIEIAEPAAASYTLAVDHAQGAGAGQSIAVPLALVISNGQATLQPFDVPLLFDAAYVIPVTYGAAGFEGQEIPFSLSQAGTEGSAAAQGQDVSLLAQALIAVDAGQAAASNEQITLSNVLQIAIDYAAAALSSGFITLTATGLAVTGDSALVNRRRRR